MRKLEAAFSGVSLPGQRLLICSASGGYLASLSCLVGALPPRQAGPRSAHFSQRRVRVSRGSFNCRFFCARDVTAWDARCFVYEKHQGLNPFC